MICDLLLHNPVEEEEKSVRKKIGHELITVETAYGVHEGATYHFLYFCSENYLSKKLGTQ